MVNKVLGHNKKALIGGSTAFLLSIISAILVGHVSEFSAQNLLQALVPNINVLCNTVILVCGTILALLFTVLSLSSGVDVSLSRNFYQRIRQVAIFDTVLIITASIIFLLLNFPLSKTDSLPEDLYAIFYYTTLVFISIIGGMIVTVTLMLYNTVSELIKVVETLDNGYSTDKAKKDEQKKNTNNDL